MRSAGLAWVDGALQPVEAAALAPDDTAYSAGVGCYTTARWQRGRARFAAAHAARLARDAHAIGLGALEPGLVLRALAELGLAAFGAGGAGIVRLQASRDGSGRVHLVGTTRPLGDEPPAWRAILFAGSHPGPSPWPGAKLSGHPHHAHAAACARAAGADDALMSDAAGFLVEGARTTPVIVLSDGILVTPPADRGGVAGVTRGILLGGVTALREQDVGAPALATAREIVLANAARGAMPVVALGGVPVGDGRPGPWSARLAAVLDAADAEDARSADAAAAGCYGAPTEATKG